MGSMIINHQSLTTFTVFASAAETVWRYFKFVMWHIQMVSDQNKYSLHTSLTYNHSYMCFIHSAFLLFVVGFQARLRFTWLNTSVWTVLWPLTSQTPTWAPAAQRTWRHHGGAGTTFHTGSLVQSSAPAYGGGRDCSSASSSSSSAAEFFLSAQQNQQTRNRKVQNQHGPSCWASSWFDYYYSNAQLMKILH